MLDVVRRQMNQYRLGMIRLPNDYIYLHEQAARASLSDMIKKLGLKRCITTLIENDGWMDGMKIVRAICEDNLGNLRDMRWSDANGGSWFERSASGGQCLAFVPKDRPGHL